MRTELLDYNLPPELIATRPPSKRDGGRMCIVNRDGLIHSEVRNFAAELRAGDLLVLNETRVRRARLSCRRPSSTQGNGGGAQVELLFLGARGDDVWEALGKANRPLRVGDRLEANLGPQGAGALGLQVIGRESGGSVLIRVSGDLEAALETSGQMPIPPYMKRQSDEQDVERYQTVFAQELGSAAAPTAGLHLTEEFFEQVRERGVEVTRVLLHVGVGTFRPVQADDLNDHPMHSEEISVTQAAVDAVAETRARGGRVVAVGTTAVRALESAADPSRKGLLRVTSGPTNLLIQPGYRFCVVDALLTNFHQPRSTLMALVSAFAGYERVKAAYEVAVCERYRFLSYGDAMWIPHFCED